MTGAPGRGSGRQLGQQFHAVRPDVHYTRPHAPSSPRGGSSPPPIGPRDPSKAALRAVRSPSPRGTPHGPYPLHSHTSRGHSMARPLRHDGEMAWPLGRALEAAPGTSGLARGGDGDEELKPQGKASVASTGAGLRGVRPRGLITSITPSSIGRPRGAPRVPSLRPLGGLKITWRTFTTLGAGSQQRGSPHGGRLGRLRGGRYG